MAASARTSLEPGLCILHGNHLEDLTQVLVEWVRAYPLGPLEDEIILVQSNGMAQWLKLALAADDGCGVSAAQQFLMPGRFLWDAYRSVLGADALPRTAPFEKSRLVWRIMRLLPGLLDDEAFAPLRRFLRDDTDQRKRHQLARRLADLFDQYQVYRADWLHAWEAGVDQVARAGARTGEPLDGNRWQAVLWRELIRSQPPEARRHSRAHIHARFCQALAGGEPGDAATGLPARIVVLGVSSLPLQSLEALSALAEHCQVLMMVQNPCRHYWGDIIEDRDLLRGVQSRHGDKLGAIAPDEQHRHANPLLAAWGKQGRDYIGLLYDFDRPGHYRGWFNQIDLFRPAGERHPDPDALLPAIQEAILELEPVPQTPAPRQPDASLAFHVAHAPQREVEILHDQLLAAFEASAGTQAPLRPRDVLVMVPDIETYSPYIEAVFGNFAEGDPRFIPYAISDRSQRRGDPLAVALERLLELPNLRLTPGDLLGLLETPALRRQFRIAEADLPELRTWIDGAGIRWGLHAGHRAALGLPDGFEQNTWWFGLRRMLLGYAVGSGGAWRDVEPYDEVGGLQAALAGRLVELVDTLAHHWAILGTSATPATWGRRVNALVGDLFALESDEEHAFHERLLQSLDGWLEACEAAGFDEPVPLVVARASCLDGLDDSGPAQRFLAGRVNFCTLMPMRSVPFRHVYLLGMNDGDYPRSAIPHDFDLMALPGQYRPGDRSRRDDDRYLFLEALLAAREQLTISWVGRDVRDNEPRPPSVLVAQLRDYLDAAWCTPEGGTLTDALTRSHPLQPFSARYFTAEPAATGEASILPLFTYAAEWRAALDAGAAEPAHEALPPIDPDALAAISCGALTAFLRDPAGAFFRERLQVRLGESDSETDDSEPFALDALASHQLGARLLDAMLDAEASDRDTALAEAEAAVRRTGELPPGAPGAAWLRTVSEPVTRAARAWEALIARHPRALPPRELTLRAGGDDAPLGLEDWLTPLRADDAGGLLRVELTPGSVIGRPDRALSLWTHHLLACAVGLALDSRLVGGDGEQRLAPLSPEAARRHLDTLAGALHDGLHRPLPLALRTGLAYLRHRRRGNDEADALARARAQYEGAFRQVGEVSYASNAALRRAYPRFADLERVPAAAGGPAFARWARALYEPLLDHLEESRHP